MDLESADFQMRHLGEGPICSRSAGCKAPRRRAQSFPYGEIAAGQRGKRPSLEVPLEGSADGLVEVVDVEHQPPVGSSVGAKVAHMRIAAELGDNAGIGQRRQVGGHHRHGAAEVAEGRVGHHLVLSA